MFIKRFPLLLAAAFVLLLPTRAFAQQHDTQARGMVRSAMEDYQNLDIDGALNRLRLATNLCAHNTCTPAIMARIHIALGVVAVGGQNNNTTGVNEFTEALRLDPSAEPDAMLVTPEITAAFTQAHQHGTATTGTRTNTTTTTTNNTATSGNNSATSTTTGTTTSTTTTGTSAALLHTPIAEQLENTPLPVYVEAGAAGAAATEYVIHFRGLGMTGYSTAAMEHVANGFGGTIPCGQVIRPTVEYYVTGSDSNGNVVAAAGTAEAPTRINIVNVRTQPAPALPGRMPADQCGEDCPPGMTGPQCRHAGGGSDGRGTHQLGDPCQSNNQCATGLHCEAGSCSSGEATSSAPDAQYRFAAYLGGGLALPWLSGTPTYAEFRNYSSDPNASPTCGPVDANGNSAFVCPPIHDPGFAPTGYITIGANLRLISRLAIGVYFRYQFNAASNGTLPNMFFGGRVMFAITPAGFARKGLVVAPFIGGGGGQMQAQPSLIGSGHAAHVISGLDNVNFGVHGEYGFGIPFVGVDLTANFQFPNDSAHPSVMFVLDAQLVVGAHF